jgi:hypothetical protein
MALPTNLTTNEVKNSAGTEIEFNRLGPLDTNPRSVVFAKVGEAPAYPQRITCSHVEVGTGTAKRRRSLVRVDYSLIGQVDTSKTEKISVYCVADLPVGNLTGSSEIAHAVSFLNSFMASLGASTTILYDGTGNGSAVLIGGGL